MPGARCTRSLACKSKKHTSVVATGSDGFNRHSPHNGFNGLFRALPGERILVVTVAHGLRLIKPGWADFASVNLAPATGVRTTRLCRPQSAPVVCTPLKRSQPFGAAPRPHRAPDAAAST